jgi:hypothetical protein
MKISGLGVFVLSAALLGSACTDDTDEVATDAAVVTDGAVMTDGGAVVVTDAKPVDAAGDAQILRAKAVLASVGPGSTTRGQIVFTQTGNTVNIALSVSGAVPGERRHSYASGRRRGRWRHCRGRRGWPLQPNKHDARKPCFRWWHAPRWRFRQRHGEL